MEKLEPHQYHLAEPHLLKFSNHTVVKTILAGITPGLVYADSLDQPGVVFTQFRHRAFLSSNRSRSANCNFLKFVTEDIFENCRKAKVPLFRLATNSLWSLAYINQQLIDLEPIEENYQIYRYKMSDPVKTKELPDGYVLHRVNQRLVEGEFLGKGDLLEEMCSERESVQAFLDNSFGLVAFKDNTLAGWCLSEYNYQQRCEVGIATMQQHRKLGLAKAMTRAFINLAAEMGIEKVLWHCSKSNIASARTAMRTGFKLVQEEPVLIIYWDRTIHLAVHGNKCFENYEYEAALEWYRKALAEKSPQAWTAWNAACAAAHLGQTDQAFEYLLQSIELGFTDLDYLTHSQHLLSLRDDQRWGELITLLNQKLFSES